MNWTIHKVAAILAIVHKRTVPLRGFELPSNSPGNSHVSDATDVKTDVVLARLVEVWPRLSPDVRERILAMIEPAVTNACVNVSTSTVLVNFPEKTRIPLTR
jgi:hypothetical protein